jgi:predicted ATPase/DNA-binding winged helix-turn-helix (wHTH) protein
MTSKFGRFQVLPHRREFLADGVPVALGSRAFDVLMVLVEAGGELVTKDEILSRVWPGMVVEEHSLQFHISTLRKVLGKDRSFIKTISGRGYRFVADIAAGTGEQEALPGREAGLPPTVPKESLTNLPAPASELIGRGVELSEASALLTAHRLVTLIGAGGIGKTRLGLDVARRLRPNFADGVWVAELGPLPDPDLVPVTVAAALGLEIAGGPVTPERVAGELGAKQLLLVLDNCEHVIDAAASMAEALLRSDPATHVLATSREPLRAADECLYLVPPLAVPAEGTEDVEDLLRYAAVQLFLARVRATDPRFALDQRIAPAIAAICRRLDGIALAIELAAARAAALGVEVISAHLDDRFGLLTAGRRTAPVRHQTLRATLDWSYELLSEAERVVLRRLSIFAGCFTLEAAVAIGAGAELAALDVINAVANLVTKSLVIANAGDTIARYALLETTRAYALEKLTESSELEPITRCHAEYCRDLLERAETDLETNSTGEWLTAYGPWIDNIRAALDWGFSPSCDASIGIALTAASAPLWMHLSLMEECRGRVEQALASFLPGSSGDLRRRMRLYAALGLSLMQTKGPACAAAAWTAALELAGSLDDTEYRLQALWGLWICRLSSGKYRTALALARKFCGIAADQPASPDLLIGDRMTGTPLHYLGDQASARRHIERMLARYVTPVHRSHIIRFQFDQRLTASCTLARILWLQGFPDQAMRTAQSSVDEARAADHALSLCNTLTQAACPIALFVGDLAAAERYVAMLIEHSARHALTVRRAEGHCSRGALFIQRGDVVIGSRYLRYAVDELRKLGFVQRCPAFLGALAEGLGRAQQGAEGLAAIDEALALCERDEERWCVAELLRIKGELVLSEGGPDAAETAEDHFGQALDWARRQGALSWELRAATSLARLWHDQNRTRAAREILAAVYDRFTEGFDTADLKAARLLLDGLRPLRRQQVSVAALAISFCASFGSVAEILAAF